MPSILNLSNRKRWDGDNFFAWDLIRRWKLPLWRLLSMCLSVFECEWIQFKLSLNPKSLSPILSLYLGFFVSHLSSLLLMFLFLMNIMILITKKKLFLLSMQDLIRRHRVIHQACHSSPSTLINSIEMSRIVEMLTSPEFSPQLCYNISLLSCFLFVENICYLWNESGSLSDER